VKRNQSLRRIGLARALSKLGYCSRSRADELIRAGRVILNGRIKRDPEKSVFLERDRIVVDGEEVRANAKIYLMMNKPRGIVTTASDEEGRETVYGLLKAAPNGSTPWIAPVGRLDKASEGLLLMTNDSEWGARIGDPATHLDKIYHVQIAMIANQALLTELTSGVRGNDGATLRAKRASLIRSGQKNCWLEIVLDEGKNRHIRRMFEAVNIEVLRLVRVAIGPLQLGDLAKGTSRALTNDEKGRLDHALEGAAHE
jgi:23S rRNA pseudouridine2605 synthase